MANKIKLVQGDTLPALVISVVDRETGEALDLSDAVTLFKLRAVGSNVVKESVATSKLTGWVNTDGDLIVTAPYDTPGRGGRIAVQWTETALDTAGEFEGEVEATFGDGSVQTVYDLIRITIRPQF